MGLLHNVCIARRPEIAALVFTAAVAVASLVLTGCGSGRKANQPLRQDAASLPVQPLNRPAGANQTVHVVSAVLLLGTVPYDNATLPLLSPDGRFIATQTGVPPTWPTTLAEMDAEIPVSTRIEIYAPDWRPNIDQQNRQPPSLVATVDEPVLLGRTCDAEGFLVESPREDGSRWIGKASWHNGQITWLVQDEYVNAFAAQGAGGRLAWSRRAVDSPHFELVVRNAGKTQWSAGTDAESWLMPTWSGRGDGLFFMVLRDGALDMRYGVASTDASLRQSLQRIVLTSENASVFTAYQTVIGQSAAIDASPSAREQIVFYHPGLMRVALWRPLALPDRQRTQLNRGSIAALVDEENFAFVSVGDTLLRQNLLDPAERIEIVGGSHVPRQITSPDWPFVLLNPAEGQVGLTALKLLPREQSVISSRR